MTDYDTDRRQDLGLPLDLSGRPPVPHDCRNGWRGEDRGGRPIPCLVCRPWLCKAAAAAAAATVRNMGQL